MMAIPRPRQVMGNAARVAMRHVGVPFASTESADPGRSGSRGPSADAHRASGTRVFWMCLKVFRGMNLLAAVLCSLPARRFHPQ